MPRRTSHGNNTGFSLRYFPAADQSINQSWNFEIKSGLSGAATARTTNWQTSDGCEDHQLRTIDLQPCSSMTAITT